MPVAAQVLAVGARSAASVNTFADDLDIPRRYTSYEALVADADIDIIYVASPHHLHKEHSLLALRAGKHVLCEKPMTLNAADAAEVFAEARGRGLLFVQGAASPAPDRREARATQRALTRGIRVHARAI